MADSNDGYAPTLTILLANSKLYLLALCVLRYVQVTICQLLQRRISKPLLDAVSYCTY